MNNKIPKNPNVIEKIITSIINKIVDTTCDLFTNIRGLTLLILASIGLGTKLTSYGLTKYTTAMLSIIGVTLLSL